MKQSGKFSAVLLSVALLVGSAASPGIQCVSAQVFAPLPDSTTIVPPDPALPPDLRAFSGKWSGSWEGMLDHILVVEEITPKEATFVYAWGTCPAWNIREPGWVRVKGTLEDGALRASLPNGAAVTYTLTSDGKLSGTYSFRGRISRAQMTKVVE